MLAPTKLDICDETSGQSQAVLVATKYEVFDKILGKILLRKRQQNWISVKKNLDNLQPC